MFRAAKSFSRSSRIATFAIVAVVAATGLHREAASSILTDTDPCATSDSSILTGDPRNLDFSNSNANLNIVIGDTDGFVGSGSGTIVGAVQFAASNVGQFNPDGITVNGGATFGHANIDTQIAALAGLSTTLGAEPGTPLTITSGGSVLASTGMLDAFGDLVFTATVGSFTPGTNFTITGASDQFVVINIGTTPAAGFNGSVVLAGGLTPDDVLFNFFGPDTLNIGTEGNTTAGIFLAPDAPFFVYETILDGRIFGGNETADSHIVFSTIDSPPPSRVPEPTSLALLGVGLAACVMIRWRSHPLGRP